MVDARQFDQLRVRRGCGEAFGVGNARLEIGLTVEDEHRPVIAAHERRGIVPHHRGQERLDAAVEQRKQGRMKGAVVDDAARFERVDRGQRLGQEGRVRRIGLQLLAEHVAHLAAHAGDEHQPAHVRIPLSRHLGEQRSFAMSEQPDAIDAGRRLELRRPGAGVVGVVLDPCVFLPTTGGTAGGDPALVVAQRRHASCGQPLGEQLVRLRLHAHRIVAVAVGGTGAGDDQHRRTGRGGGRSQERSVQGRRVIAERHRRLRGLCGSEEPEGGGCEHGEHHGSPMGGDQLSTACGPVRLSGASRQTRYE